MANTSTNQPPQAVYTKQPGGVANAEMKMSGSIAKKINPKARSRRRAFYALGAIIAVVVVAFAAIFITSTQRQTDFTTTPTEPQAAGRAAQSVCTLGFTVPEETPSELICEKSAYISQLSNSAGNYSYSDPYDPNQPFSPGDEVVFRIDASNQGPIPGTVTITDVLQEDNLEFLTFIDSTCGEGAYDPATNTLTCANIEDITPTTGENPTRVVAFRALISEDITADTTITNTARISDDQDNFVDECQVSIDVDIPEPTDIQCVKNSYANVASNSAGEYTLSTPRSSFEPGDIVVFEIPVTNTGDQDLTEVSLSDVLTGNNLNRVTFLDSNCGANSFNATTSTLSCDLADLATGDQEAIIFRVQVDEDITSTLTMTNTGLVTGTSADGVEATDECSATITIEPEETTEIKVCGSTCTQDSECPNYHSCNPDTNQCALTSCLQEGSNCTGNLCEHVGTTTSARCNDACTTNSDCTEANQVCYQNRCRLATNPNSPTCSIPNDNVTYNRVTEEIIYTLPGTQERVVIQSRQEFVPGTQPILPEELPVAGAEDALAVIGGAALLVISGVVFLLLL